MSEDKIRKYTDAMQADPEAMKQVREEGERIVEKMRFEGMALGFQTLFKLLNDDAGKAEPLSQFILVGAQAICSQAAMRVLKAADPSKSKSALYDFMRLMDVEQIITFKKLLKQAIEVDHPKCHEVQDFITKAYDKRG